MSDAAESKPSEAQPTTVNKDATTNPPESDKKEGAEVTDNTKDTTTPPTDEKKPSGDAKGEVKDKATTDGDKKEKKERRQRNKTEGGEDTAENEIRVAAKGQIKNYLGYAFRILNKTDHKSLKIRATGNAIVKALILIELVKRRVGDLHQLNKIYSMEIVSLEESKIEGMGKIENKRRVTAMDTVLSKDPLDTTDPGYQEPEPKEENTGGAGGHSANPNAKGEGKKEGGVGKQRGKKLYNQPLDKDGKIIDQKDKEDGPAGKGGKRQDRDMKNKDKDGKGKPKPKKEGGEKGEHRGRDEGVQERDGEGRRGGKSKSRRYNIRNKINDDEVYPRPTQQRGGRRGDRGGDRGGGRFDGRPRGDRGGNMGGHRGDMMGGRNYDNNREQLRDMGGQGGPNQYRGPRNDDRYQNQQAPNMKSHDDFFVRPTRGQRGGGRRQGGPVGPQQDMYPGGHHGGPQGGFNNYGPPPRNNYNHEPYQDPYYNQYPRDNYGAPAGGNMMYGGPPPRNMYQGGGQPQYREGGRDDGNMRQGGPQGGQPRGGNQYPREQPQRGPQGGDRDWDDQDPRQGGQNQRGRGNFSRGTPWRGGGTNYRGRGGRDEDGGQPHHHHNNPSGGEDRPFRGRGERGRGGGRGRGDFQGGSHFDRDMVRGPRNERGGHREQEEPTAPQVHRRMRGGAENQERRGGNRGGGERTYN